MVAQIVGVHEVVAGIRAQRVVDDAIQRRMQSQIETSEYDCDQRDQNKPRLR